MGTTGTITGVSRFLKEKNSAIRIIGAQPGEGSRIPGIRKWPPEYLPKIFEPQRVDETVNVSLGLPIRRTSVDHGTAFDIAWQGKASPVNMRAAVAYARLMADRMPAKVAA